MPLALGSGLGLTQIVGLTQIGGSLSLLQQVIALSPTVLYDISQLNTLYADRSATPSTPASVDGVVGTILDPRLNGRYAIAPSDAARAILRNVGGLYYLDFDGIDDNYLDSAASTYLDMFSACRFENTALCCLIGGQSVTNYEFFLENTGFLYVYTGTGSSIIYVSDERNKDLVLCGRFSTTTSAAFIRVNGATVKTGTTGAAVSQSLFLGRRTSGSPNYFKGKLWGVVGFDSYQDAAGIALVEQYQASLNGVSL